MRDGKVQATFDLLGIRYTGTGYLSSAMAMDKRITKEVFPDEPCSYPRRIYHDKRQSGERHC